MRFDGGLRFGNILEDMDAICGSVAYQHCDDGDKETYPLHLVGFFLLRLWLEFVGSNCIWSVCVQIALEMCVLELYLEYLC